MSFIKHSLCTDAPFPQKKYSTLKYNKEKFDAGHS